MKITDIIMEDYEQDLAQVRELERRGYDPRLLHRVKKLMAQGLSFDAAMEEAKEERYRDRRPKDPKPNTASAPAQTPPPAKKEPRPASTPDDQRTRQDIRGRNLRHDRYYRDHDDFNNKPDAFSLPDTHFDYIPGVKTVKKAAKTLGQAKDRVVRGYKSIPKAAVSRPSIGTNKR